MRDIIFSYFYRIELNFMNRSCIKVIDEDGEYTVECERLRGEPGLEKYKAHLSEDIIDQIKQVYMNNKDIFDIEEVEFPPVLDGCCNSFVFSDGKSKNEIRTSNLWYFLEEPSEAPNAMLLLKVFAEIKEILVTNGVDEKYFVLYCE